MSWLIVMWPQSKSIHAVVSGGWVGVVLAQTRMPTASPSLYHLTDLPTSLRWNLTLCSLECGIATNFLLLTASSRIRGPTAKPPSTSTPRLWAPSYTPWSAQCSAYPIKNLYTAVQVFITSLWPFQTMFQLEHYQRDEAVTQHILRDSPE